MRKSRTRFETRTPWEPLPFSPWHEAAWQFLATAALVFGAWYIGWRWLFSLNYDALWFAVPLVLAETLAYFGLVIYTVNLWTAESSPRPELPARIGDCQDLPSGADRPIGVDIFFTTYNEPPWLVRLGIQDASRIIYPHPLDLRIYVLDDGMRPEMAKIAAEEGVNYITRPDNAGFKAGNLRNALAETSGDFILICDADTRPFPTILTETLGYFRDPKMAWVQTPQWFCDIPPGVPLPDKLERWLGSAGSWIGKGWERVFGQVRWGEDPFSNDPQLFYDFILRRRNWANASFCCGAASIHRREAVIEAGLRHWANRVDERSSTIERRALRLTGERVLSNQLRDAIRADGATQEEFTPYQFHVSEDIYTSLVLHADRQRGWKSMLHPVIQSKMLSPNDLVSWTVQRFKYAGGTLDIFFNDSHIFGRGGLSFWQRIMYLSTFYSYISSLWLVVFFSAPIIYMTTAITPVEAYTISFFVHIIPFLVLNELAQMVGTWGVSSYKSRSWYLSMFPINLRAIWVVLMRQKISFPVTPKDRQEGYYPRLVKWQILVVLLTVAALLWGWSAYLAGREGYSTGAVIANTLWGLNNVAAMIPIIRAAFWRPHPVHESPILAGATQ